FILISFLTGTFIELAIILFIVLFHELGHYAMATFFGWHIKNIVLWVFGGVMNTENHGNTSIVEEALVTIAGPLQHVIIYMGMFLLTNSSVQMVLPPSLIEQVLFYNTVILLFNLIPIWPLDGGKLLFTVLSAYVPYRASFTYSLIVS